MGTAGQKLGGSAALCHIRHDPTDPSGCFILTAANVGKCQVILCRDGKPMSLSLLHNVGLEEEYRRIRQHRAIVTEVEVTLKKTEANLVSNVLCIDFHPPFFQDNKVNGVTDSTRIMGYSFLYPSVIPCPYVQTVTLTPQDEFFILGSRGLWDAVSPTEAVEAVRNVPDGLAAAKKLCTLAQGYGCTDSLSAVVVQLSVSEDCCSCCCSDPPQPPPSPGLGAYPSSSSAIKDRPSDGSLPVPPSSCSEISSEISTSEMSSEVGSTASSDEPPQSSFVLLQDQPHHPQLHLHHQAQLLSLQQQQSHTTAQTCQYLLPGSELASARNCCALHPACLAGSFQRQLSSATFSSALSDNGLDSEDEEPIAGVFSNGSRVEVEADVHCLKAELSQLSSPQSLLPVSSSQERTLLNLPPPPPPPCTPEPLEDSIDLNLAEAENGLERDESWPGVGAGAGDGGKFPGKRRVNGSVARQEKSHNLIEVAADAPSKKSGGYFTAPAQPDPDDQFIIPPELEEEVKEIMKQHQQKQQKPAGTDQPTDYYDTPL